MDELRNNKSEICRKAKISESEFEEALLYLNLFVLAVDRKEFEGFSAEAEKLVPGHPKDVPFFALALSLNADAWSNEKRWKLQKRIRVFSTKELIEFACRQGFSFI